MQQELFPMTSDYKDLPLEVFPIFKAKRYQGPFGVVTDGEVGAVRILQVILGPRLKT